MGDRSLSIAEAQYSREEPCSGYYIRHYGDEMHYTTRYYAILNKK